jgi:hypothetical protein
VPSWRSCALVGVLAVIISLLKVTLFTIIGTICGFAAGIVLHYLLTNLVLLPIFSLLSTSSPNDVFLPTIKEFRILIPLASAIVGGGAGYLFGFKK